MKFYLDTCIWLNLFKREGDHKKGKPYWKIAEDFIRDVKRSKHDRIIYSGFILKELKYKLDDVLFKKAEIFLNKSKYMFYHKTNDEHYSLARKYESESKFNISFIDCMNIAICKLNDFILITRDKELIKFSQKYIEVCKPEDL